MKKTILALSLALMIGAVACKNKGTEGTEPATTTDSTQVVTDSSSVVKDSADVKLDSTEKK